MYNEHNENEERRDDNINTSPAPQQELPYDYSLSGQVLPQTPSPAGQEPSQEPAPEPEVILSEPYEQYQQPVYPHEQPPAIQAQPVQNYSFYPSAQAPHSEPPPPPPAYTPAPQQQGYNTPPYYNYYNTPASEANRMYTPGICVQPPPARNYRAGSARMPSSTEARQKYKLTAGAVARTICLILVCTVLSAAAAYLVIDYRLDDLTAGAAPNQVILGGGNPQAARSEDGYTTPLITQPDGSIPAQDIYDIALTQVVGISITTPETTQRFGFVQPETSSVAGSGFIISADGYILTNYHVIEMARAMSWPIDVIMHDGSSYRAEIVGFEASSDVAVLKIDASGLNPAFIGNSSELRVGQTVYAVGNPFGDLVYTMTDGIVSALDRVVSVDGKTISTFQFSAAVNSGNSGGPVYNTSGEVVGIVTAKVIRGNVEGIGFAIPINDAISIATALIEHGYISGRAFIGIAYPVTISESNAFYFDWVVGVGVRGVFADSAAERAGIRVGDIITAINDDQVDSVETLQFILRKFKAGDTANITVWRDGTHITSPITFDENMDAGRPNPMSPPLPENDPFAMLP